MKSIYIKMTFLILTTFSLLAPFSSSAQISIEVVPPTSKNQTVQEIQERDSNLKKRAQKSISAFQNFCSQMKWNSFDSTFPSVTLSDEPLISANGHETLAGRFTPSANSIEVSARGLNLEESIFHELVHWAHYQKLGQPNWFTAPPANIEWVLEAIPFLAYLNSPLADGSLLGAEARFIGHHLSGSLFAPEENLQWYGLVGLWSRYLNTHVSDVQKLIQSLASLTPENPVFDTNLFEFSGEEKQKLRAVDKKLENIFEYFAISLIENSDGINAWNLFLLSPAVNQSPIDASSERWSAFTSSVAMTVAPHAFFYVLPGKIPAGFHFEADQNLRIVLWQGSTRAPIDLLKNEMPLFLAGNERILIYNPSDLSRSFRLTPSPAATP